MNKIYAIVITFLMLVAPFICTVFCMTDVIYYDHGVEKDFCDFIIGWTLIYFIFSSAVFVHYAVDWTFGLFKKKSNIDRVIFV